MARQTARGSWPKRLNAFVESRLDAERDQLFLWIPVAVGIGITAWFVLPDKSGWIAFLLLAGAVAVGSATLPRGGRLRRAGVMAGVALAIGCALIWWRAEQVALPRLDRPVIATFQANVAAVDRLAARGITRLTLDRPDDPSLPPRFRLNVADADVPAGIASGVRVHLRARLMPPPQPAVPGAYDFARVAWFQGLGATGRALGPVRIVGGGESAGVWQTIMGWRTRLSAHVRSRLPDGQGGVAAALATGDQGGISEADAEAMRRSGLAHLLSISGLHVTAVVAGAMLLAMRLMALSPALALRAPLPLLAAGVGALAGVAYTLLAGAEVPTVRSCVAALLVLVGIAMGRDAVTLRLVATGALIVMLLWPEVIEGPSFQLSFAAVTAIVVLHEYPPLRTFLARREEGFAARWGRALLGLLLTGIAVELALTPIALFHFHKSGLYGAFANIVAIPLTTFIVMPAEVLALALDVVGWGAPAWWMTGKALALVLWIAHTVASAPGAVMAWPMMPDGAFALMVLGGLWMALWRTRMRRLGLVPFLLGAIWAMRTPAPDLIVTGDGRHLAIRGEGAMVLLRPRAGGYMRDMLGEAAGNDGPATAIDDWPDAKCSPDACIVTIERDGRQWTLLATRSPYWFDIADLARACAAADIAVSDRRLPRSCRPRWLKADRQMLSRTGGLAINLAEGRLRSVAQAHRGKPWAAPETAQENSGRR